MIELETHCTTCGADFTPSHDAYVRGTWRTCTRCRDGPGDEVSGAIEPGTKRLEGQINGPKCQPERKPQ